MAAVDDELRGACERLSPLLPPTEQALFTVHRMMLGSDSLIGDTLAGILQTGRWAPTAWRDAVLARVRLLERAEDPHQRPRRGYPRPGPRVPHHLRGSGPAKLNPPPSAACWWPRK
ncbi:MAG: hypothetical protein IPM89_00025 [Candidatus Competibacteraceae bacterium]|nr:MAG: hypothetical protein IPM89_00025 [Candidatus Competibacteraceae bacterium]